MAHRMLDAANVAEWAGDLLHCLLTVQTLANGERLRRQTKGKAAAAEAALIRLTFELRHLSASETAADFLRAAEVARTALGKLCELHEGPTNGDVTETWNALSSGAFAVGQIAQMVKNA